MPERAGEFVLRLLPAAEHDAAARAAAEERAVAEAVAYWSATLDPLLGGEEADPPPDLFDRILAGIEQRSRPPSDGFTVRASEGLWETIAEGVERKLLWASGPNGRETFLVRMRAGARYASHQHADDEECFVVSGDLTFDTLTLRDGDYHLARRGGAHPTATTVAGCLLLITAAA